MLTYANEGCGEEEHGKHGNSNHGGAITLGFGCDARGEEVEFLVSKCE